MSIFSFFRPEQKSPAAQAKERLQIVMAHERSGRSGPDFLPMLQQELLAVIAKYVDLDENKVEVKLDRGSDFSTLEVNIELPGPEAAHPVTRPVANEAAGKKDGAGTATVSQGKVVANVLANGGGKGRR